MANILDRLTLGEGWLIKVDGNPADGAGTDAPIGSHAQWEDGSGVGRQYVKVGSGATDWDKIQTAGDGGVQEGSFLSIPIYNTDGSGVTIDDQVLQNSQAVSLSIEAQASRTTAIAYSIPNPGDAIAAAEFILSEGVQSINGEKTFNDDMVVDASLTVEGDLTVNGTLTYLNSTNTEITDALVRLNKGGAAESAAGSGIEFEEDGSATGSLVVSADRMGFELNAPAASAGLVIDSSALTADRSLYAPDESGSLIIRDANFAGDVGGVAFFSSGDKVTTSVDFSFSEAGTALTLGATGYNTNASGKVSLNYSAGAMELADSSGTLKLLTDAGSLSFYEIDEMAGDLLRMNMTYDPQSGSAVLINRNGPFELSSHTSGLNFGSGNGAFSWVLDPADTYVEMMSLADLGGVSQLLISGAMGSVVSGSSSLILRAEADAITFDSETEDYRFLDASNNTQLQIFTTVDGGNGVYPMIAASESLIVRANTISSRAVAGLFEWVKDPDNENLVQMTLFSPGPPGEVSMLQLGGSSSSSLKAISKLKLISSNSEAIELIPSSEQVKINDTNGDTKLTFSATDAPGVLIFPSIRSASSLEVFADTGFIRLSASSDDIRIQSGDQVEMESSGMSMDLQAGSLLIGDKTNMQNLLRVLYDAAGTVVRGDFSDLILEGTADVQLKPAASGKVLVDGNAYYAISQSVAQTTNATPVQLEEVPLLEGQTVYVKTRIVCKKVSGAGDGSVGDSNVYVREAKMKKIGGATIVSYVQSSYTAEDISAHNIVIDNSGTNGGAIKVVGSANNVIDWEATTEVSVIG